jgi:hypothetical protein
MQLVAYIDTLCVMPMDRLIISHFVLVSHLSFAGDLDKEISQVTDSLKSVGVENVFVYQYSLFTGSYNISYDDNELECDSIPTVAHVFWNDNGRWRCQRLDYCGRFKIVDVKTDFSKLRIDGNFEFKKKSAHFTRYRLTKLSKEGNVTVYVSGAQLREDRNSTTKTFKKIKKLIQRLEDSHKFKRME